MTIEEIRVADLRPGHVFRTDQEDYWRYAIGKKRDRFGWDVNYSCTGREGGWRGFNDDDVVQVWIEASG